jgi:hypothetical protein
MGASRWDPHCTDGSVMVPVLCETGSLMAWVFVNVEMTITTNYKLVSIVNRVGNFDITQVYTLKTTIDAIKATGNGKGSLQYDIANSNYIHYQMDTDLDIGMTLEKFNLDVKSISGFIQTTIITKN